VTSAERGAEATHIFQGSILLVSGVYYDIDVLPGWMQPLSALSPATNTRSAGLWAFVRIEAWAKKTGKLKRTG
jgi:ABC-2 type transport system permease protein